MSRFDCNIDSPSCTIPANTGESAESGGGGGASNVHTITSTSDWTAKEAGIASGDTVVFTGSGTYTMSGVKIGITFIATSHADLVFVGGYALTIKTYQNTSDVTLNGNYKNCTVNAFSIKFDGTILSSIEYSTIHCNRIYLNKQSGNITVYAGAKIQTDTIFGTGTSNLINYGCVKTKDWRAGSSVEVQSGGELLIYNGTFSSFPLQVNDSTNVTSVVYKNTGSLLHIMNETVVTNS